jgi:hypothetical protein
MFSLKDLYSHFKNSHPGVKGGFLKFASLQPKNFIMASVNGTHSVCKIHQNEKLMLEACKICEQKPVSVIFLHTNAVSHL